jgi:hypothetical protein
MSALDEYLEMRKAVLSKHLNEVDWQVRRHQLDVAKQAEIVEELESGGYFVQMGLQVLEEFEDAKHQRILYREKLLQELAQLNALDARELDEGKRLRGEALTRRGPAIQPADVLNVAGINEVG